jgi:DNA mismatch repair ATPase MutS
LLTRQVRLLIVSGSNMSGKSTLLRTVGVNVVLAMAGAPVRAARLVMTPLSVGATLHVHDSLQAGRSRFYAEISRIRAILDLTDKGPAPIFFLDELFQGTNSHDRKIGAEALLTSLVARGAIGLTTTHALALTAIADPSGGRIVNVHFEDQLLAGELVFDYRMKPGPVTHSNALALMRAVGLPVEQETRRLEEKNVS